VQHPRPGNADGWGGSRDSARWMPQSLRLRGCVTQLAGRSDPPTVQALSGQQRHGFIPEWTVRTFRTVNHPIARAGAVRLDLSPLTRGRIGPPGPSCAPLCAAPCSPVQSHSPISLISLTLVSLCQREGRGEDTHPVRIWSRAPSLSGASQRIRLRGLGFPGPSPRGSSPRSTVGRELWGLVWGLSYRGARARCGRAGRRLPRRTRVRASPGSRRRTSAHCHPLLPDSFLPHGSTMPAALGRRRGQRLGARPQRRLVAAAALSAASRSSSSSVSTPSASAQMSGTCSRQAVMPTWRVST